MSASRGGELSASRGGELLTRLVEFNGMWWLNLWYDVRLCVYQQFIMYEQRSVMVYLMVTIRNAQNEGGQYVFSS